MKKYAIIFFISIIIVLILFGGYYVYSVNSQDTVANLKAKANEEIIYLGSEIISMMNKFNNITYANYKVVEETVTSNQEEKQGSTSSSGNQGSQSSSGNGTGNSNSQGRRVKYYY